MTRILIADGQHILRRGLRCLLEMHPGWEVVAEAEDSYGAINAAMRTSPDIAILDCSLRRMNGLESAQRIRQQRIDTEFCMLAFSAEESAVVSALHLGIRGFMLKSDAEEEMIAAVDALSQRRSYVSRALTKTMLGDYIGRMDGSPRMVRLTPREREVVQLVAEGLSNKQIGKMLDLSIKTVECHRGAAMRKAGLSSIADLVRYAVRNHFVQI